MATTKSATPDEATIAGWQAVAALYHAYFTGLILTLVTRRGADGAARLVHNVFRAQHHAKFLAGIDKLGLAGLPDAVKAARYHYLSNKIGGVKVEYMEESERKAWVRFVPPRWVWDGTAICGIPTEVSRGMLTGWYGHNGVSLGNPRLGFVATAQGVDAQYGLAGYFLEHDRDLVPEERLRFSPGEEPPPFDPDAAPWVDPGAWPAARLDKANRNYAMDFVSTALPEIAVLFGPAEAAYLGNTAGKLIGMQYYDRICKLLGLSGNDPESFARLFAALASAQDDPCAWQRDGEAIIIRQTGWRLMRGRAAPSSAVFDAWNGLWQGALQAHDRFLALEVLERMDYGDDAFAWRLRRRGPSRLVT
jgi:hypothetical protein